MTLRFLFAAANVNLTTATDRHSNIGTPAVINIRGGDSTRVLKMSGDMLYPCPTPVISFDTSETVRSLQSMIGVRTMCALNKSDKLETHFDSIGSSSVACI